MKDREFTESEIMKALECASFVYKNEVLTFKGIPIEEFSKAVADLLLRKNAEIEELQHEKTELQHKIRELNFENLQLVASFRDLKAEAIKEYSAELLGKYCFYDEDGNGFVCDTDIYNLAKEMGVE